MMLRSKKIGGVVVLTLALASLILPGRLDAMACEDGFNRCMSNPVYSSIHVGTLYCGLGYLFCKKYVE